MITILDNKIQSNYVCMANSKSVFQNYNRHQFHCLPFFMYYIHTLKSYFGRYSQIMDNFHFVEPCWIGFFLWSESFNFLHEMFLTAILHRGLGNCFFLRFIYFFQFLFGLLFPFFYLDISRHFEAFRDISRHFETFRDISRHFETFRSFFDLFSIFPIAV